MPAQYYFTDSNKNIILSVSSKWSCHMNTVGCFHLLMSTRTTRNYWRHQNCWLLSRIWPRVKFIEKKCEKILYMTWKGLQRWMYLWHIWERACIYVDQPERRNRIRPPECTCLCEFSFCLHGRHGRKRWGGNIGKSVKLNDMSKDWYSLSFPV